MYYQAVPAATSITSLRIKNMSEHPIAVPGQAVAQEGRTLMELLSSLNIYSHPVGIRKTGVICTIGKGGVCIFGIGSSLLTSQAPPAARPRRW